MKAVPIAGALLLLAWAGARADPAGGVAMLGFTAAEARVEAEREEVFDAALDPGEMRGWMEEMASAPNDVGSPHDRANADFILARLREWGWDAREETYQVRYPTPGRTLLELAGPGRSRYRARLAEPTVLGDRTSRAAAAGLPPCALYGAQGDVTAEMVYANFGRPEDYRELERRGVSAGGRIVLVRDGPTEPGLVARLAREHGAVALVLFADPREDGYRRGDPYPKGPWRPEAGVRRDSVVDIGIRPGDPTAPSGADAPSGPGSGGAEAVRGRLLPGIPVLAVGAGDARPFLAALEGDVAPDSWQGALALTYHLGPGPGRARLVVDVDWSVRTVVDVVGVIRGADKPDEWVVRGNPHDAWVFGAWDPLSGTLSLLEEARAVGILVRQGWRPRRTLVFASWDGSAPGLIGSTLWAQAHAAELRQKAVLYVGTERNGRGFLQAEGSPEFGPLVGEVAGAIADPDTGVSVLRRLQARSLLSPSFTPDADALVAAPRRPSDLTPFLEHLGIPCLGLGYGGFDQSEGVEHSSYDSFDHYLRFADPTFAYEAVLSRTVGRVVLRAANAGVLPVRWSDLAEGAARELGALRARSLDLALQIESDNQRLASGDERLAADALEDRLPSRRRPNPPELDWSALTAAVEHLRVSAAACDAALARAADAGLPSDVTGVEATLLDPAGLSGHPWYRSVLFGPGLNSGVGGCVFPGIRESIECGLWSEGDRSIRSAATALEACARRLDAVAADPGHP